MLLTTVLSRVRLLLDARCHNSGRLLVVELPQNTLCSAPLRKGGVVICRAGIVWLTQTGDARDHVLSSGQTYRATHAGKVVITALEDAIITHSAGRTRPSRRCVETGPARGRQEHAEREGIEPSSAR